MWSSFIFGGVSELLDREIRGGVVEGRLGMSHVRSTSVAVSSGIPILGAATCQSFSIPAT